MNRKDFELKVYELRANSLIDAVLFVREEKEIGIGEARHMVLQITGR